MLRILQILAVIFMAYVIAQHYGRETTGLLLEIYWREALFAVVGVTAAWLFAVTHFLRPVVAVFAAAAFFVIASLDDPSAAGFLAALDGIAEKVLAGVSSLQQG